MFPQLQLISEVRGIIRPRDLNRFNEMCVHREIAAKKVSRLTLSHPVTPCCVIMVMVSP